MAVGEAEVLPLLRHHVELVARLVVAQPVAGVGGEVELLGHRMPVEAHAVAHAVGHVLEAGAVGIHAGEVGVGVGRHTDIAGRADVEVELAVGAEGEVLPAVRQVLGQGVVDHFHGGRTVELVLDARHLADLRHLGDVERAVLEGHAVRQVQAGGDGLDLALPTLVHHRVDIPRHAAAHEQRALVAPRHGAGIVDAGGPQLGLESRGHLDLVDGNLAGGLGRGRLGNGGERRVGEAGRLALLPGRGRRLLRPGQGGEHAPDRECHRDRCEGDAPHDVPPL